MPQLAERGAPPGPGRAGDRPELHRLRPTATGCRRSFPGRQRPPVPRRRRRPRWRSAAAARRGRARARRKRGLVFTETGYHNALHDRADQPPASEEAAAVYFPRLLLAAFGLGARRTFIYELLDEKPDPGLADLQQHFGLLRNDFSPKPAFTAIKTLIARRAPVARAGRPRTGSAGQLCGRRRRKT